MKFQPLIDFFWKHGAQLEALGATTSSPETTSLILDIAEAVVTIVKKRWPGLNANGLLDNALTTLRDMLSPD
jgi:hypothetical protein